MNQNQPKHSSDRLDPLSAPLSDNARGALAMVTWRWLSACRRTIAADRAKKNAR
jgi:hypothetical protein